MVGVLNLRYVIVCLYDVASCDMEMNTDRSTIMTFQNPRWVGSCIVVSATIEVSNGTVRQHDTDLTFTAGAIDKLLAILRGRNAATSGTVEESARIVEERSKTPKGQA